MKILAISGSLRAASINSALLRAAARLAPSGTEIAICSVVTRLPLFNPDLEARLPADVVRLHAEVAAADALLIASPEYAHGVTGTIKNTLDWLVSFEPFVGKLVAVLNASPRAHQADWALRETLRTMSARIVEAASISIPALGPGVTESEMVERPSIAQAIRESLAALCGAVATQPPPDSVASASIEFCRHHCHEVEAFLAERIYEFNSKSTGYFDGESFAATRRDETGTVVAGVSGYTWGGCCYVSYLWVAEEHRGLGLGSALLQAAEKNARDLGCVVVHLSSHSFAFPGFYRHLGYEEQAAVRDHPVRHSNTFFAKRLAPEMAQVVSERRSHDGLPQFRSMRP